MLIGVDVSVDPPTVFTDSVPVEPASKVRCAVVCNVPSGCVASSIGAPFAATTRF